MRLIQENSEKDIARHEALRAIEWPLRELAANIMRVTRGAGKGHDIGRQCVEILRTFEAYRDIVGHYPTDYEVRQAINLRFADEDRRRDDVDYGIHEIMEGSLQFAASKLVGQTTQQSAGERQMFDGIEKVEKAREINRQKWQASAVKPKPRPPRKK